ncbi:mitochondrial grpe [Moniliophthora roreri MCA 2997]|uniref:GrpE protein homolog, mitochondrial n=2 Tax=Moniliophthora roreri TaxID=221103 RepID=V2YZ41_MONRO|nr:mitochondrial grpe [Moniliophthora roreri MCA 2997]KAI3610392.1 mitochondrial grpe [Moniliophthora roreri]
MNSAPLRQLVRSCTTSLSSRALARPSLAARPAFSSQFIRRNYSEGTSSPDQSAEKKEQAKEDAPAGEKAACPETEELKEKLKTKEAEATDLMGRLRYLQADFVNLQRNSAREKEQTRDYAITRFATDLLETVDVLSLALKSVPPSALPSPDAPRPSETPETKSPQIYLAELHHGVEITQRQLLQTLFKYHVKPFDPTGDKFDPNRHEALYQAPIPGKEPGTVIDCQKVGYTIKDRVLRAAQVGVAQETQS